MTRMAWLRRTAIKKSKFFVLLRIMYLIVTGCE